MEINKIYQGDSLDVLKTFPDESINMCMTSPPYWALRDYGTASWKGGKTNCDHISGKNRNDNKREFGTNTILFEQYKNICKKCGAKRIDAQVGIENTFEKYIEKLISVFDEIKRVLKADGTCWVNIADTYSRGSRLKDGAEQTIRKTEINEPIFNVQYSLKDKSLCMIPQRFAIAMINRGWILRNVIVWHKPSCMPQSVKDRFTVDFEYIYFFVKNKNYYFEQQFDNANYDGRKDTLMKGSIKYKNTTQTMSKRGHERWIEKDGKKVRNKRTTWSINPEPFKEAHFACYPTKLCETPIKAGCPENGIVLDPFMGAGTTALTAVKLNRNYIGIELNPEYIKIAEKRIKPYYEKYHASDKLMDLL